MFLHWDRHHQHVCKFQSLWGGWWVGRMVGGQPTLLLRGFFHTPQGRWVGGTRNILHRTTSKIKGWTCFIGIKWDNAVPIAAGFLWFSMWLKYCQRLWGFPPVMVLYIIWDKCVHLSPALCCFVQSLWLGWVCSFFVPGLALAVRYWLIITRTLWVCEWAANCCHQ